MRIRSGQELLIFAQVYVNYYSIDNPSIIQVLYPWVRSLPNLEQTSCALEINCYRY